jgi:hypothetical protein
MWWGKARFGPKEAPPMKCVFWKEKHEPFTVPEFEEYPSLLRNEGQPGSILEPSLRIASLTAWRYPAQYPLSGYVLDCPHPPPFVTNEGGAGW